MPRKKERRVNKAITLPDHLVKRALAFCATQTVSISFSALTEAALERFLNEYEDEYKLVGGKAPEDWEVFS